mmetsp:Transcript_13877/g.45923  ORF Transcript_13877/g.45923 Transcript_13877/m.45923 type:complete len:204 (-) Transcript_13877:4152-4763(-)
MKQLKKSAKSVPTTRLVAASRVSDIAFSSKHSASSLAGSGAQTARRAIVGNDFSVDSATNDCQLLGRAFATTHAAANTDDDLSDAAYGARCSNHGPGSGNAHFARVWNKPESVSLSRTARHASFPPAISRSAVHAAPPPPPRAPNASPASPRPKPQSARPRRVHQASLFSRLNATNGSVLLLSALGVVTSCASTPTATSNKRD